MNCRSPSRINSTLRGHQLWAFPSITAATSQQRCQALIRHLRPVIEGGLPDDHRFGGPLDTTFLLAMATPMIVLPVERIFKPARPGADVPADDRELDPELAGPRR